MASKKRPRENRQERERLDLDLCRFIGYSKVYRLDLPGKLPIPGEKSRNLFHVEYAREPVRKLSTYILKKKFTKPSDYSV